MTTVRLTYSVQVDYIGAGYGPMSGRDGPLPMSSSGMQSLTVGNSIGGQFIQGSGTSNALQASDITTVTAAMAADIAAQLSKTAALNQMNNWPSAGG